MKLTKQQARLHTQAESRLAQDVLSRDDKLFILEHWREDANHVNSTAGAFFTPWGLALDFALDAIGGGGRPLTPLRIIDLCAGIGTLSLACQARHEWDEYNGAPPLDITCVEVNPVVALPEVKPTVPHDPGDYDSDLFGGASWPAQWLPGSLVTCWRQEAS